MNLPYLEIPYLFQPILVLPFPKSFRAQKGFEVASPGGELLELDLAGRFRPIVLFRSATVAPVGSDFFSPALDPALGTAVQAHLRLVDA